MVDLETAFKFAKVLAEIESLKIVRNFRVLCKWQWKKRYGMVENMNRLMDFVPSPYDGLRLPPTSMIGYKPHFVGFYVCNKSICTCKDFKYRCRGPNRKKTHCKHIEAYRKETSIMMISSKRLREAAIGNLIMEFV